MNLREEISPYKILVLMSAYIFFYLIASKYLSILTKLTDELTDENRDVIAQRKRIDID